MHTPDLGSSRTFAGSVFMCVDLWFSVEDPGGFVLANRGEAASLGAMKHIWIVGLLSLGAWAGGCSRQQEPAAATESDPAVAQRAEWFGERAAAADIVWRPSGLGVRIITPGEGAPPKMTDTVRVHYTGRLKDGTVFDDSRARGQPEDFVVNRLITGWAAGMASLRPGGRAEIFVPPKLGYGALKVAGVPPNSALIFDVELIAVNP